MEESVRILYIKILQFFVAQNDDDWNNNAIRGQEGAGGSVRPVVEGVLHEEVEEAQTSRAKTEQSDKPEID